MKACEEIEKFNGALNKSFVSTVMRKMVDGRERSNNFTDKKHTSYDAIKNDLISVINMESPTSLRKAILEIFNSNSRKMFDRKTIKKILERKYHGTISTNSDSIRSMLSSLMSNGFIKRATFSDEHYYMRDSEFDKIRNSMGCNCVTDKKNSVAEEKKLELFLSKHIGKEIEFRYKTERLNSDRRWRRVRVYDWDDKYLSTTDYYLSGRRIKYLKKRIVEYRELCNT
ncbi:hypothetical protein IJG27_00150 [Candidatus Saccharibacteria bacterium]|nr:hypothetical protein [Candidatus Saccharibacteria bacterium]